MGVRENVVRSVVVSVALGVALLGCGGGDDGGSVESGGSLQQDDAATATTWDDPCAEPRSARCEAAWQEQRQSNRRHADRHDFLGDPANAEPTAAMVRDRLARFAGGSATPSAAAVEDALARLGCREDRAPGGNARRLASLIAATVLCGELSLLAAQTNQGELMASHLLLERRQGGAK